MADYFGLDPIISLILLIIPFTNWFCGIITRLQDKCYVAAIIRIFLTFPFIWVADIIFTILNGCKVTVWRLIKV